MAEKRMFTQKIVDSDAFLDMPLSTQALYFHLNMRADDDGFINNPKRIQRTIGASEDDLKLLILKRFVIGFESGVIVIKHWRMHNTLRKDRYNPTQYQDELEQLQIKGNNAYTERFEAIPETVATTWQPNGNQPATQYRLVENSIDKSSEVEVIEASAEATPPPKKSKPVRHKHGEYENVLLTDEELEKLKGEYPDWQARIDRLSSYIASTGKAYKSHYVTIRNWAKRDAEKGVPVRKEIVPKWAQSIRTEGYGDLIKKSVARNNSDLQARAEALKNELAK